MSDKSSIFCRFLLYLLILSLFFFKVNQSSFSRGCCHPVPGITVMTLISLESAEYLLSETAGTFSIARMVQKLRSFWKMSQKPVAGNVVGQFYSF